MSALVLCEEFIPDLAHERSNDPKTVLAISEFEQSHQPDDVFRVSAGAREAKIVGWVKKQHADLELRAVLQRRSIGTRFAIDLVLEDPDQKQVEVGIYSSIGVGELPGQIGIGVELPSLQQ